MSFRSRPHDGRICGFRAVFLQETSLVFPAGRDLFQADHDRPASGRYFALIVDHWEVFVFDRCAASPSASGLPNPSRETGAAFRFFSRNQLAALVLVGCMMVGAGLVLRHFPFAAEMGPVAAAPCVYEVRGSVRAPGYYCFSHEQTLDALLRVCGGTAEGEVNIDNQPRRVASGTRVTFGPVTHKDVMGAAARMNFFLPVDVNAAEARDLELLPGVGPKTARAIVAYCRQHGGVKSVSELTAVQGIGQKTIKRLSHYLTVCE